MFVFGHILQARNLVACRSILCELFVQDWPNLSWGRLKNIEVDSIKRFHNSVHKWDWFVNLLSCVHFGD